MPAHFTLQLLCLTKIKSNNGSINESGWPVEVKDVLIDRTDDEEHTITLLLE